MRSSVVCEQRPAAPFCGKEPVEVVRASGKEASRAFTWGGVPGNPVQLGGGHEADQSLGGEIVSPAWPGKTSGSPSQCWLMSLGLSGGSAAPTMDGWRYLQRFFLYQNM